MSPTAVTERERLDELHRLRLLDTQPEERFDRYTRIAMHLFETPVSLISLVDEDRNFFKSRQGFEVCESPRDMSFCGKSIEEESMLLVEDATKHEFFSTSPLVTGEPGIRFYAGCPIRVGDGAAIGSLCVIDTKPRTVTEQQKALLRDLADMVQQEFHSMRLATTDELTGLSNRRGFGAIANHSIAVSRRTGTSASLLYFDLDRFKEINDTLGHAQGDVALQDFSELLLANFRDVDVVARMGGDEFCVLVTGDPDQTTSIPLDRFEKSVEEHNANAGREFTLYYSVGTVVRPADKLVSVKDLLDEADRKMFERKRENPQAR
ncbi:MAG: sensor domain-containing diguanylate cyclase [Planctomycetota bacterium]|jgi:diguanylate cyclase (GGDEF)-like protein